MANVGFRTSRSCLNRYDVANDRVGCLSCENYIINGLAMETTALVSISFFQPMFSILPV